MIRHLLVRSSFLREVILSVLVNVSHRSRFVCLLPKVVTSGASSTEIFLKKSFLCLIAMKNALILLLQDAVFEIGHT